MKHLLFLAQRIPYPPNKGDKLRSFAVLRHLARSWHIHLGCFIDDPNDWQYIEALRPYCADIFCVGLDKRRAMIRSAKGLLTRTSLSEHYFHAPELSRWVGQVLRDKRPPVAFLYSSVMGQYIPQAKELRPGRVVMDFVDVDSVKWQQYADMRSWPMHWVYTRESRRLFAFDRKLASRFDASIFVSGPEAALFRRMAPEIGDKVHAISNGIDHAFFTADPTHPNPYPADNRPIVMTGAMDYWPNVDAALWFARDMLPAIRAQVPAASFTIVGGSPTAEVKRLAELPGITVTGRVSDVRPYLTHASAVVAPLRVARGIQNKVLEGMSMGKVVVTSQQGLEGIDALPDQDLLVADDAQSFIAATVRGLTDNGLAQMGTMARQKILANYDWDDKLAAYESLLQ